MPMSVMSDLTPRGLNVRIVRIWPGETNCWDLNGVGSSRGVRLLHMDDRERLERWTCQLCRKVYVVPDLARMCEEKHLEEEYNG